MEKAYIQEAFLKVHIYFYTILKEMSANYRSRFVNLVIERK